VFAAFIVASGTRDFNRALPPVLHRGVRVQYVDGAQPWEGLREAIEALELHQMAGVPMGRVVITIHPPGAEIVNGLELNGTMRVDSAPLGPDYIFIAVRQLSNSAGVRNACISAIHHEYAEHAVPLMLDGDPNIMHDRPELTAISAEMTRKCLALLSQ
jgi:hypothetical protein